MTLKQGGYPGYPDESLTFKTFSWLMSEGDGPTEAGQRDATLLALKMDKGATGQREQAASKSWKRLGN